MTKDKVIFSQIKVSYYCNGRIWFSAYLEKKRDNVFDKFIQSNKTRTGIGLSLLICREMVALHHGGIAAEVAKEGGIYFDLH